MPNFSIVLTCLICLLVGRVCQGFSVSQPQGRVEALERSNVTLVCVVSSETPPGPGRWYKGAGSERTHFYSAAPKGGDKNDPRVNWTMENTTVNYSITIRDLRVSDTGEYYCEKYTKADNESKPYASGPGVTLTVRGVPIITGPASRVKVGNDLELTCEVNGASDITVKWFKDEQEVTPELRDTSGGRKSSRSVIRLTPKIQDIKSIIRCQESGLSAQNPLGDKFHLKDVIAVLPGVPFIENPKLVLGDSVNMKCKLSSVYPKDIMVTWTWDKMFESSQSQHAEEHEDGTFTVTSVLSFIVKEDMRGTRLTCQAGYEGLTPVSGAVTLGVRGEHSQSPVEAVEASGQILVCVLPKETLEGHVKCYSSQQIHIRTSDDQGNEKEVSQIAWTEKNLSGNVSLTMRDVRGSDLDEYCEKYKKTSKGKPQGSDGLLHMTDVSQPQSSVEAVEGGNVTLTCILSSELPLGPIKWYKEVGSERTHFYSAAPHRDEKNDPRVAWTMDKVTVDFSITIRNIRFSDMGEYYCVKYRKGEEDKPYASGPGVTLTVRGA